MFAGQTLLSQTRSRIARNVPQSRTVFVVTRNHAHYYQRELRDVPPNRLLEQPSNRGTAAAIAFATARVGRWDSKAILGLYPADHHYEDVALFSRTVAETYSAARRHPDRIFLLGTEADCPEVEYGWIEPGATIDDVNRNVLAVTRFWEKPTSSVAGELLARGCLWNTFVMIGSVGAFRGLLYAAAPEMVRAFEVAENLMLGERETLERVYDSLEPVDFSREVLAPQAERIGVIRLPNSGWTDLGQPARVQSFLTSRGAPVIGLAS